MIRIAHLLGLGLAASAGLTQVAAADVSPEAVIAHYVDVAEAKFDDALATAKSARCRH
jgi:uncharacterized iron-regulated protein